MTQRSTGVLIFLATLALLAFALIMESVKHLMPCNLCILQRIAFIACGIGGFLWWVLPIRVWSRSLGGVWIALSSIAGILLASRQIYLQHLPVNKVPACGPGFNYLLENFPLSDALSLLLKGDGNCAAVDWRLFGLTMASWSCLVFLVFLTLSLWRLFKK